MPELTPNECRVLGVLVEKAQTTPGQYPMTLNGIMNGCNQKSNRAPVTSLNEEAVLDALDGLRSKSLAREVMMTGSRVAKYRHTAREGLNVDTNELVVLTELMLRGPQTLGEIRGRASRMHPLESTDIAQNICSHLAGRDTPLVKSIGPAPGSRAGRFVQLVCPKLHPIDRAPQTSDTSTPAVAPAGDGRGDELEQRIAALENEVQHLRRIVDRMSATAGTLPTDR